MGLEGDRAGIAAAVAADRGRAAAAGEGWLLGLAALKHHLLAGDHPRMSRGPDQGSDGTSWRP